MTYRINKSDGTFLLDLLDNRVDSLSTSITLVGTNVSYGEYLNENFVRLLENFSSISAPDKPITGQIWYNSKDGKIKVYNGSNFIDGYGPIVKSTKPTDLLQGDIWIDDKENQLWFYDGTDLILSGPIYKDSIGVSGFVTSTVQDTAGYAHVIVQLLSSGKLLGILSKDSEPFELATPILNYDGVVYPGFNQSTLSNFKFYTNFEKTNALLDSKGNLKSADSFMITNGDTGTVGTITLNNTTPLKLGSQKKTTIYTTTEELKIVANGQTISLLNINNAATYTALSIRPDNRLGILTDNPAATVDIVGAATFFGNLQVGAKFATTASLTNLNVSTPSIFLNYGEVGEGVTNALDSTAGLNVDRGTLNDVAIRWNESTKRWELTNNGIIFEIILTDKVVSKVAITSDYQDLSDKPDIGLGAWTKSGDAIYYEAGNVGIGKIPDTNFQLDVAGSIVATSVFESSAEVNDFDIIDLQLGNFFNKLVIKDTAFKVINTPCGVVASFILRVTNGGNYTVRWWRGIKWKDGKDVSLTADGTDILAFYSYDCGETWIGMMLVQDVKVFPVYFITSDKEVVYEGQQVTFFIDTQDVLPNAQVPYTITGIDQSDITTPITGIIVFDNNSKGTITVNVNEDVLIEGVETLRLTLGGNYKEVSVMNTTSFNIIPDKIVIDEGDSVTYTVLYSGVPVGTVLTYQMTGIKQYDIVEQLSGTFVANASGKTSILITTIADQRADGSKNMMMSVSTASAVVTVLNTSTVPDRGQGSYKVGVVATYYSWDVIPATDIYNILSARELGLGFITTLYTNDDTVPTDLSEYAHVWDVNYNTPMSTTLQTKYFGYLNDGGAMFILGENASFNSRNQTIVDLYQSLGSGTLGYIPERLDLEYCSINPDFLIANENPNVSFDVPGAFTMWGSGTPVAVLKPSSSRAGLPVCVCWETGSLANAPFAAVVTVLDVNFWGTPASDLMPDFIDNLILILNQR